MPTEGFKVKIGADASQYIKQLRAAREGLTQLREAQKAFHNTGRKGAKQLTSAIKLQEKAALGLKKEFKAHRKTMQDEMKKTAAEVAKATKNMGKFGTEGSKGVEVLNKRLAIQVKGLKDLEKEADKIQTKGQRAWQKTKGMAKGMVSGLAGGALGIGSFLLNVGLGAAEAGFGAYMQYGAALSPLIGMDRSGKKMRGAAEGGRRAGGRYGIGPHESLALTQAMGRATGAIGGGKGGVASEQMMMAMRATGLGAGEVGGVFGELRQAGLQFTPQGKGESEGLKEFGKIIEIATMKGSDKGIGKGLERGRLPEFLAGVSGIASQMRVMMTGKLDVGGIAKQLRMVTAGMGEEYTGESAVRMMNMMQGAFAQPRGGLAGQMLMKRAMGFGKPGGETSLLEAERRQERAAAGATTVQESINLIKQITQESSNEEFGREQATFRTKAMFGVTTDVAERLMEMAESGADQEDLQEEMKELLEKSEPIEKQALKAQQSMVGPLKTIARVQNQSIKLGEEVAPMMIDMQKAQHALSEMMVQVLSDIYQLIKYWVSGGDRNETAVAALEAESSAEREGAFARALAAAPDAVSANAILERAKKAKAQNLKGAAAALSGYTPGSGFVTGAKYIVKKGGNILSGEGWNDPAEEKLKEMMVPEARKIALWTKAQETFTKLGEMKKQGDIGKHGWQAAADYIQGRIGSNAAPKIDVAIEVALQAEQDARDKPKAKKNNRTTVKGGRGGT